MINRLIEVEYDKKDKSGDITKYWGWCKGQIVAYRKHEGYLVNFADRIDSNGRVIAGWSDWIEDLNEPIWRTATFSGALMLLLFCS